MAKKQRSAGVLAANKDARELARPRGALARHLLTPPPGLTALRPCVTPRAADTSVREARVPEPREGTAVASGRQGWRWLQILWVGVGRPAGRPSKQR